LLSALLTLQKGRWFVEAYGTNLTDESYVSGQAAASRNEFYGGTPPIRIARRCGVLKIGGTIQEEG
jgi:hypothetical protein